MTNVLCVAAQRGGCGKTTTTQAVGQMWSYKAPTGTKGLWVDLDPQGNLTDALGVDAPSRGSIELMTGQCQADEAITKVADNMDLLPATDALIQAEATLLGQKMAPLRLARALEPIKKNYGIVLIDTPPSLGILTLNGLMAADSCLIPSNAERFSLKAVLATLETINAMQETHALKVAGVLITRFLPRQKTAQAACEAIRNEAQKRGVRVFRSVIRDSAAIREAQGYREDVVLFDRSANASQDYASFYRELMRG